MVQRQTRLATSRQQELLGLCTSCADVLLDAITVYLGNERVKNNLPGVEKESWEAAL